ncbi:MAG: orotidine-5'-phosphate decarboxylase [Saprospiraceae bacterium]|nr:orotidine-5'-phosphate decarboxylase [Saprospiraceae bacterium]MBP6448045.1 orotidine-5'-phosphate decarboxylase [Saprospiraceae bacterium]
MTRQELVSNIKSKSSFLCVGLDTDLSKIPAHILSSDDPVFEFNKMVIDATSDLCVAYKPNLAFYESRGPSGWKSLEKTMDYIPDDIFTIADAKRGDIGNTSKMYAKTFFEYFNFDAVTVAPYMGEDSVTPFLEFDQKWVILLGLTSNEGSTDFQMLKTSTGMTLYESVIVQSQKWGNPGNLMYVIGATHPQLFSEVRQLAKEYFFLVPGVGAQGGDLEAVVKNGKNDDMGLLINSSREIIYAGDTPDFQNAIRQKALTIQGEMSKYF